jgi:hypothetical protein
MAGMDTIALGYGMADLAMVIMAGEDLGAGALGVGDGTTIGLMAATMVSDIIHHGIMDMDIIIGDGTMVITTILIDIPIAILEEVHYFTITI